VTSISAPSHKQQFDHAQLYPPGLVEASSGGPGPIRRYRSMTPSAMRNAENIRRPMTASSQGDYPPGGSPGSSAGLGGAPSRGYHPYAQYTSSSRGGSTHSSPSMFPIPLAAEFGGAQGPHLRRSESRNSNLGGMHEQMRQMMNISDQGQSATVPGMYRTDSPGFMQTESPATFSTDLPPQYGGDQFGVGQQQGFEKNGFAMTPEQQFGFDGMTDDTFYHNIPHHHATI